MQSKNAIADRLLICVIFAVACSSRALSQDPASAGFFEAKIRPVLIEYCYECHSENSEILAGSLRVDTRDGLLIGGDGGPAIAKGDPHASPLVTAMRYESLEMPPTGRLPERIIKDFESWIAAGAFDPRDTSKLMVMDQQEVDHQMAQEHWAFLPRRIENRQSLRLPVEDLDDYPSVGRIDDFLNQSLHALGIRPNAAADPQTQLRRLYFDLTGLPPTIEQQDAWLADPSDRNWSRFVDELLASWSFGEHWARHWMDIARYADSNGSDFNATFHEAWRYRDFLIRAFNHDRPFDQMIRQQVAGDLLSHETDQERYDNVVATTFLMLGTKMLSERDKEKLTLDVVDEQIDTVGRAFLGLTLGCARCHDHKFDPIPTEDYYALAGIFRSTQTLNGESQKYVSTWNRVDLPASDSERNAVADHQETVGRLRAEIKALEEDRKRLTEKSRSSMLGVVVDDQDAKKTGVWKASTFFSEFVGVGYVHDDATGKGKASIQFSVQLPTPGLYEVRLSHSPGKNRAARVPLTIATAEGEKQIFLDQRRTQIAPMWSSVGVFEFDAQQETSVTIRNVGTSGYVIADAVQFIPQDPKGLVSETTEASANEEELERIHHELTKQKKALEQLEKNPPPPLPVAMAPSDHTAPLIADSPIHIRGEVRNLGATVPRGFLRLGNTGEINASIGEESGRMQLANWLTQPEHPLVSRVFVNRVWMHLFGEGLVRTVDNFGRQGEAPTHLSLLDDLADGFVQNDWSLKGLIRELVTSHAYRRSSANQRHSMEQDPLNQLLWRNPRRRLSAESIRDSMIFSTGNLDRVARSNPMAGRGVLVSSNNAGSTAKFDEIASPCRSIYLPVVRGYLSDFLVALDMADPDLLVGKRATTNVPSQALILINSREVNQWAHQTSLQILSDAMSFSSRLEYVTRLLLQRYPKDYEISFAKQYFANREDRLDAWVQYISAIYASSAFRFLD